MCCSCTDDPGGAPSAVTSRFEAAFSVRPSKAPQYPQKRFTPELKAPHRGHPTPVSPAPSFVLLCSSTVSAVIFWIACRATATASSLGLGRRKSCFILTKNASTAEFGSGASSGSFFESLSSLLTDTSILLLNFSNPNQFRKFLIAGSQMFAQARRPDVQ